MQKFPLSNFFSRVDHVYFCFYYFCSLYRSWYKSVGRGRLRRSGLESPHRRTQPGHQCLHRPACCRRRLLKAFDKFCTPPFGLAFASLILQPRLACRRNWGGRRCKDATLVAVLPAPFPICRLAGRTAISHSRAPLAHPQATLDIAAVAPSPGRGYHGQHPKRRVGERGIGVFPGEVAKE